MTWVKFFYLKKKQNKKTKLNWVSWLGAEKMTLYWHNGEQEKKNTEHNWSQQKSGSRRENLKGLSRWWELKVAGAELLAAGRSARYGCWIINTVNFIFDSFWETGGFSRTTQKKWLIFHWLCNTFGRLSPPWREGFHQMNVLYFFLLLYARWLSLDAPPPRPSQPPSSKIHL